MGLLVETGYQQPIATLSCSDSQLSVSQAKGHMGLQHLDEAFLCLRGSCQLLEHALGEDLLDVCHIYGHNHEPINEFTDHVAKMEAANSFYFQRPSLNLKLSIPHLWLLFEHDHGGPSHNLTYLLEAYVKMVHWTMLAGPTRSAWRSLSVIVQRMFSPCVLARRTCRQSWIPGRAVCCPWPSSWWSSRN